MAPDDVATGVARVAVNQSVNVIEETGVPEHFRVDELVRPRPAPLKKSPRDHRRSKRTLRRSKSHRENIASRHNAGLGETRFEAWLIQQATARAG